VTLFNKINPRQMVASSSISGLWRIDKFHGLIIPSFWVKVNVANVHMVEVPLMHPHELDNHVVM
jgi:hypothetical protein